MRRARYQHGSLQRIARKTGPAVWTFRWYEVQADGRRRYRKAVLGTVERYRTESEARRAADALRLTINDQTPRQQLEVITMDALVAHYRHHELPDAAFGRPPGSAAMEDEGVKAFSTQRTYEGYLAKWILPRWGSCGIRDVKAVQVEQWLRSLPLARGSRAKARNILSALFSHAIRWEFAERNPITEVRQSAKRSRIPAVLSIGQVQALLAELAEPVRTIVLLGAATGLRIGELLGLRWADVDFERLELHVRRSVVMQRIGPCKTEASQKPVPLDAPLAEALLAWRQRAVYGGAADWIFASPHKNGAQPYWPGTLHRVHLKPALARAGITAHVGWHTLRHTFGTLMKANGEDVKVIQELLRHATYKVTMDTYTQAVTPAKRQAQSRVVRMLMSTKEDDDAA